MEPGNLPVFCNNLGVSTKPFNLQVGPSILQVQALSFEDAPGNLEDGTIVLNDAPLSPGAGGLNLVSGPVNPEDGATILEDEAVIADVGRVEGQTAR